MSMISLRVVKLLGIALLMLAGSPLLAQEKEQKIFPTDAMANMMFRQMEANRILSEIELAEREVRSYDKTIKANRKQQARMKDKAGRLKYRVVRKLSDMDTTVPHRTIYVEWQLIKAEKAEAHAALQIANAEKSREERILYLGDKITQYRQARGAAVQAFVDYAQRSNGNGSRVKVKATRNKRHKDILYLEPR